MPIQISAPARRPRQEKELQMSAYAHALPRIGFKRPKFDRDRAIGITRDWWVECKAIMRAACPLIMVPSPIRELLPAA
jgi:hypothetical protein